MSALRLLILSVLFSAPMEAQHQLRVVGSLIENGAPWSGAGKFRFAIVDAAGRVQWVSHKQNPFGQEPAGLLLNVRQGQYEVVLGASTMPPIPSALAANPAAKLRVWFDDGLHGLRPLEPDLPLFPQTPQVRAGSQDVKWADVMNELRQIKQELQQLKARQNTAQQPHQHQPAPAAPPIVSLAAAPRPALGEKNAPVVLVEFTDFDCGFCRRFDQEILPELRKKYVETGRLRIESSQLPLAMHPRARRTAEIVLCANDRFWEARDLAFKNPDQTHDNLAAQIAELTGYNVENCLAEGGTATALNRDLAAAREAGITATPTFVLGRMEQGKITGERLIGAPSLEFFEGKIEALLSKDP